MTTQVQIWKAIFENMEHNRNSYQDYYVRTERDLVFLRACIDRMLPPAFDFTAIGYFAVNSYSSQMELVAVLPWDIPTATAFVEKLKSMGWNHLATEQENGSTYRRYKLEWPEPGPVDTEFGSSRK